MGADAVGSVEVEGAGVSGSGPGVKGCCTGSIGNRSGNSLNDICIMSTSSEPYRSSGKRSESVKNEFLLKIHRSHPPCCLNRSNCIGQL